MFGDNWQSIHFIHYTLTTINANYLNSVTSWMEYVVSEGCFHKEKKKGEGGGGGGGGGGEGNGHEQI